MEATGDRFGKEWSRSDLDHLSKLVEELPPELRHIASAFESNVRSAKNLRFLPERIVWLSEVPKLRARIATMVKEAWKDGEEGAGDEMSFRSLVALREFNEQLDRRNERLRNLLDELDARVGVEFRAETERIASEVLTSEPVQGEVREIRLLSVLLIWSSLEILAGDVISEWLSLDRGVLNRAVRAKDIWRGKRLPAFGLGQLVEDGFDLSAAVQEALLLQSWDGIKDVFLALLPTDKNLARRLKDPDLRLLFLRRNLIVHSRGVVDSKYRSNSSDDRDLGARLDLKDDEVKRHLQSVIRAGTALLEGIAADLKSRLILQ